jgi:hypothetical protein
MPYKHNEPRRHKIPKARYKVSNWREYDQALQQRGSLTVWVTPEALEAWAPEKSGRRGRPTSYSDIVIETAVMLRLAMGKPWRQTEGMLRLIIGMLGLDLPVPDHTTLSRRSARLSLTTTLKKPKEPVNVVIDSSGLKIFGAGEWLHEKHGGKPRRSWRRLHLAVDPDSSDILAVELTTTKATPPWSARCSTKSMAQFPQCWRTARMTGSPTRPFSTVIPTPRWSSHPDQMQC